MSLIWLLLIAASALTGAQRNDDALLTVSAAISLTEALEENGRAFTAHGGPQVRFNFAGSNLLARQIVNGAPADVFISADEAQMDVAQSAGAIIASTRVDLLGNRLAVIVSDLVRVEIQNAASLARPEIRRIALADPEAVPAGVYARRYLEAVGVWKAISSKCVPASNVRAALTTIQTGAADAAIVYESDAAQPSGGHVAFIVTGPAAPRIVYPAAVVASSRHPKQAEQFLAFLQSTTAREIFKRYRFTIFEGKK